MKDDGQPAFPVFNDPSSREFMCGALTHGGMTLRQYYAAHAPAQEINNELPLTAGECARFLGMEPKDYDGEKHYFLVLAKSRHNWADAMIAEGKK